MLKSRFSALAVLLLLVGLGVFTFYMWFAPEYRIHLRPGDAALSAMVSVPRGGGGPSLVLTVSHTGRYPRMVLVESQSLAEPFGVRLTPEGGAELERLPADPKLPAGRVRNLQRGQAVTWRLPLERMYGKLPPGRYTLTVAYDTTDADERAEPWAAEVDLGRLESAPVNFTVAAPK